MSPTHVARIMGVDPGKATGLAVIDLMQQLTGPAHPLMRHFYLKPLVACTIPWDGYARNLRVQIQVATEGLEAPFIVANEKYVVTRLTQQSQDTQSLEVSGALLTILDLLDVPHTFCSQLPSSAKMLMTDARLSELLGMPMKKLDDHTRDALRHAGTWAVAYVHNKTQIVRSGSSADTT